MEATDEAVYAVAHGCYVLRAGDGWLAPDGAGGFAFDAADADAAARLRFRASDLGTYLLYDQAETFVTARDGRVRRDRELVSDLTEMDDAVTSGAEWVLAPADDDAYAFTLRARDDGRYLADGGLSDAPAPVSLVPATGCAVFPELTVDAVGEPRTFTFADGTLFGAVDTHSHLMSDLGFGGGGMVHGAAFHPLGVTHALRDCTADHGEGGRRDLLGAGFSQVSALDQEALLASLLTGELAAFDHHTDGYPTFTDWPNAHRSQTHQAQYYRWLERAWLGGLRLVVQHATTNEVLCELVAGIGARTRYSCNDMVAVDRVIDETYALERYVDAQAGGPGRGWFRVVATPAEARAVIAQGKLAVVLGIEVSNLFDCFLTRPGAELCDEDWVTASLDRYYARGVRAIFPVHKSDNAFSPGDGDRSVMELGNFIMTGHYSNFTEDCDPTVPTVFDYGDVVFGGLNQPRDTFDAPPPVDFSGFGEDPVGALVPHLGALTAPPLVGDYCQNAGLTPLGEHLVRGMMARGMILEIDHLPRRAYARVFEMLEESDYPAAGTHGENHGGRLYALGGVSKTHPGRCRDPQRPGATGERYAARLALLRSVGAWPAEGFGFDLNGFAGAAGPRFGEHSVCETPQSDPLVYPFRSFAGDVTLTRPQIGERVVDFDTEGMVHIGMMPELVEEMRRDGVAEEVLEGFFRSAEGYLRMWEKAEARAQALR